MSQVFTEIGMCLERGDAPAVEEKVRAALEEGHSPLEIIQRGLVAPMEDIGVRFRDGEVSRVLRPPGPCRRMGILKPLPVSPITVPVRCNEPGTSMISANLVAARGRHLSC